MSLSAEGQRILVALVERRPNAPLTPEGVWNKEIERRLLALGDSGAFGAPVGDPAYAQATMSGLNLLNDGLDTAHRLAMSGSVSAPLAKSTLDYWHGLMHRREPDYANSKYWFDRVGDHPIFPDVCRRAREAAKSNTGGSDSAVHSALERTEVWDPFGFIDLCERYEKS